MGRKRAIREWSLAHNDTQIRGCAVGELIISQSSSPPPTSQSASIPLPWPPPARTDPERGKKRGQVSS